MRSVFRIVCLIIGFIAFAFALNEFAPMIFDSGSGNLWPGLGWSILCAAAFSMLIYLSDDLVPRPQQRMPKPALEEYDSAALEHSISLVAHD